VSTGKRDEALSAALSSIAEHGITISLIDEPTQFVRNLSRKWIDNRGRVADKPRHSNRYLARLLKLRGTPVQSLTSKLAGKRALNPDDADALIRLCLSCWHYVGDPTSNQSIQGISDLYRPMLSNDEAIEVASYFKSKLSEYRAGGGSDVTLPGENTADLVATEFAKSDVLFSVSSQQTLITAQPKQVLIGFRDLVNRLWETDGSDHRNRILVWVLDLGRQEFEDGSRFWNVQELRSRFKALKLFKERRAEARWGWLQSKTVIALHDPRANADKSDLPAFTARDALFSEIPRSWARLQQIRTLYGRNLDGPTATNFTIFLSRSVDTPSKGSLRKEGHCYDLRYFGHALFAPRSDPGTREARGLQLPPPGKNYADAFWTIYRAATEFLQRTSPESIHRNSPINKIHGIGFRLLGLEEFMGEL
jgi:hypothetical protein